MEKTALFFSNIEALSSFLDNSTALNLFILPKLKIVSGLFGEEELRIALGQYGATIVNLSQLLNSEKKNEPLHSFSVNNQKPQGNQYWGVRQMQQSVFTQWNWLKHLSAYRQ
jgi:hypothetical protein